MVGIKYLVFVSIFIWSGFCVGYVQSFCLLLFVHDCDVVVIFSRHESHRLSCFKFTYSIVIKVNYMICYFWKVLLVFNWSQNHSNFYLACFYYHKYS